MSLKLTERWHGGVKFGMTRLNPKAPSTPFYLSFLLHVWAVNVYMCFFLWVNVVITMCLLMFPHSHNKDIKQFSCSLQRFIFFLCNSVQLSDSLTGNLQVKIKLVVKIKLLSPWYFACFHTNTVLVDYVFLIQFHPYHNPAPAFTGELFAFVSAFFA